MTTTTHELQLVGGRFSVTFTETPEVVYVSIRGARARGFERRKVERFMFPLVDAYRDDPRRLEINGEHAAFTGHVRPLDGGWIAYHVPVETEARQ